MEENRRNPRQRRTLLLDLPNDIIQRILLLFSVKSLLRLKCVSKSFCSLISSENFVKAHLLKSSKDASFTHHKIVTGDACKPQHPSPNSYFTAVDREMRRWTRCYSLSLLLKEGLHSTSHFFRGSWRRRESITVRSCNGLVCEFSICGKDFTLRNPSTRKYKQLPPVNLGKGIYGSPTSCGFGYVESSNDYKVFALSLHQEIDGVYRCIAKVYSLKRDCWRIVDDNYRLKTPMDWTARYLDGMLYWLRIFTDKNDDRIRWEIISFDLEKEEFGITVEQPDELKGVLYTPQLGVFNGSLCVFCNGSVFKFTDVWILGQNARPSWTKLAVFPDPYSTSQSTGMAVSTNGVICRYCDQAALFYYLPNDMRRRSLRIVELDMLDGVCAYVESLVSLGNNEEEAGECGRIIDCKWRGDDDGMEEQLRLD